MVLPPGVDGLIGPHKSPCMSSSASSAQKLDLVGNGTRRYLLMMQPSQSLFASLIVGSPRTISPLYSFCNVGKFKCPNLACHFHKDSSTLAAKADRLINRQL
jgi:hypothetical protein